MLKNKLEKITIDENGYLLLTYLSALTLDGIIVHSALTKNYAAISYIPVMKELFEYSLSNYRIKEKEEKKELESLIGTAKEVTMELETNDTIYECEIKIDKIQKIKEVNFNNSILALSVGTSLIISDSPVIICGLGIIYLSNYIMSEVDELEDVKYKLYDKINEVKERTKNIK